jgi:hypothetical protein
MSPVDPERRREIADGFPDSAAEYMNFLTDKLQATAGSFRFKIHHPAPSDLSTEQMEVMAEDLREIGWGASVAPITEGDEIRFGILIEDEDS